MLLRSNFLIMPLMALRWQTNARPTSIRDGLSASDISEVTAAGSQQSAAALDRSACAFYKIYLPKSCCRGGPWWLYPATESIALHFSRLDWPPVTSHWAGRHPTFLNTSPVPEARRPGRFTSSFRASSEPSGRRPRVAPWTRKTSVRWAGSPTGGWPP